MKPNPRMRFMQERRALKNARAQVEKALESGNGISEAMKWLDRRLKAYDRVKTRFDCTKAEQSKKFVVWKGTSCGTSESHLNCANKEVKS